MIRSSSRWWPFSLVIITFAVLMASFYFEYVRGLNPCPLCLMQRFCVILMLILVGLTCSIDSARIVRKILLLQMVVACCGIFFSVRQLWLQSLPEDQIPVCLPGIGMMFHYLPWRDAFRALFLGGSDCAEISWTWLGFSMPAWTALYFVGMLFAALFRFKALRNKPRIFNKNPYL